MASRTSRNVYLIGFSGTGKSAVGRELAARLGRELVDTDEEIVRLFHKSIDRVFAEEGEVRFRQVERALVEAASLRPDLVVSLGGGAILDPASRARVLAGIAVRLDASPETILCRLRRDGTEVRPLLAGEDPLSRIRALKASREQVYSTAHLTVDTDGLDPSEVAARIMDWLASREQEPFEAGEMR